jgi:TonB family protein
MIRQLTSFVGLSLFGIFVFNLSWAQTSDAPKRKCSPPQPIHTEDPPLPRHLKTKGEASLNVSIDENGRVTDATMVNSSGDGRFDTNALKTIKKWTFKPSLCDGKPSPVNFVVQMRTH